MYCVVGGTDQKKATKMISLRSFIGLLSIYVIYLLIGGFVFKALEMPVECGNSELNATLYPEPSSHQLSSDQFEALNAIEQQIEILRGERAFYKNNQTSASF